MWAAIVQTAFGVVYLLLFGVMLVLFSDRLYLGLFPIPVWQDMATFAAQADSQQMAFVSLLQVVAWLQALAFLPIVFALHELAPPAKQILSRIGMACALTFVIFSSMHYYVQWAAVRLTVLHGGALDGLGQFVQFNLESPLAAINIVGWTLFQGLATFTIASVFGPSRLEQAIQWAFRVYGISGIVTAVLMAVGATWIIPVFFLSIGVIDYGAYPLLVVFFWRALRSGTGAGAADRAHIRSADADEPVLNAEGTPAGRPRLP
jgi:hypothetical protein